MNNFSKKKNIYEKYLKTNFILSFFAILAVMCIFIIIMLIAYLPNRPKAIDSVIIEKRKNNIIELRAEEDLIANSYGWIDKNEGIVRIPIQRAIDCFIANSNHKDSFDN